MNDIFAVLSHHFIYDPTTPLALRWRNPPRFSKTKAGYVAGRWKFTGTPRKKQRVVGLGGAHKTIAAAKVVWVLNHGTEPTGLLSLKDPALDDIRISNLIERRRAPRLDDTEAERYWRWRDFKSSYTKEEWRTFILRRNLWRDYKITAERLAEMTVAQNGNCAICGNPETLFRRGRVERLSIDHDHATGVIRGLLCGNCNNGLGRFGDDPERLRAAADYIERHRSK